MKRMFKAIIKTGGFLFRIPGHIRTICLTSLRWLQPVLRYRRRFVRAGMSLFTITTLVVVMLRGYSALEARAYIFQIDTVPAYGVAIIFGAQVYTNGNPSAMLADRIQVGAKLYQSGKVRMLLMTGDNHIDSYNEPEVMRQYALRLGVPAEAITLDYAGFRTYDSCYRARDIFKLDEAILVTQAFHMDRALLICNSLGIRSVGVTADFVRSTGYAPRSLISSQLREFPATTVSIFDLLRDNKPTFLGEPLPIKVE